MKVWILFRQFDEDQEVVSVFANAETAAASAKAMNDSEWEALRTNFKAKNGKEPPASWREDNYFVEDRERHQ